MQPPVSIVTGAASGIGRHMTGALLCAGHVVFATDVDYAGLAAYFTQHPVPADRLHLYPLDVTRAGDWEDLLAHVHARYGRVDHLLNIAGVLLPGYVHVTPGAAVDLHVDVNVKGVIHGTRLAAARMVAQGHGHIINVASLAGLAPIPGISLYSASKFAVRGYSLAAASELRPYGVFVTVINPDLVDTPMLDLQLHYPEAALSFSGPRVLGVEDVEQAFWKALQQRPREISVPFSRGAAAKVANAFPALAESMRSILTARGRKRAAQLASARQALRQDSGG